MASSKLQIDDGVVKDDLNCVKCKSVPKDACLVPCGCRLCRICINYLITSGVEFCMGPSDECGGSSLSQSVTDYRANRNISKLPTKCSNKGCVYACQLANMDEHLRVCPRKSVECPFRELGCTQDMLAAEEMSGHLQRESLSHSEILIGIINNVNNEMGGNKKDIGVLKKSVDNNKRQFDVLKRGDESKNREIEMLKKSIDDNKRQSDVLKKADESKNREIDILKKRDENNTKKIEKLRKTIENHNKEIELLNKSDGTKNKEIEAIKKTCESNARQIQVIMSKNERNEEDIQELKCVNFGNQMRIDILEQLHGGAMMEMEVIHKMMIDVMKETHDNAPQYKSNVKGTDMRVTLVIAALYLVWTVNCMFFGTS